MIQGGFSVVPKDRSYFKLRVNLEKQLCLTVQQVSENERDLEVERCFGVLVSPGRNVKHSDMHLLEMVSANHYWQLFFYLKAVFLNLILSAQTKTACPDCII
jgi:hypothetical protein